MTRHCPECDRDVMPTKVDGGAFRCPEHGWINGSARGASSDLTPRKMQRQIDQLQRRFYRDYYR